MAFRKKCIHYVLRAMKNEKKKKCVNFLPYTGVVSGKTSTSLFFLLLRFHPAPVSYETGILVAITKSLVEIIDMQLNVDNNLVEIILGFMLHESTFDNNVQFLLKKQKGVTNICGEKA